MFAVSETFEEQGKPEIDYKFNIMGGALTINLRYYPLPDLHGLGVLISCYPDAASVRQN